MSEPLSIKQRSLRYEQIRQQLTQFRGARRQGMFGIAELVAVGLSVLMVLLMLVSYIYFLVPAQSRLASLQRERERLRNLLHTSEELKLKGDSTKAIVERITGSMEEFEMRRLAPHAQGRMDLYDELNDLITKNSLRNTSGPTYTTLEPAGSKAAKKSSSTKWQSVYPGIAVTVTVEGQYQNLRHFVRDIENAKQFVIINGVELERATETNTPLSADGSTGPASGSRGSLVSLRLDLATYFQRTVADNATENAEQK
jgi:Tfp pilus assembly protein PilO